MIGETIVIEVVEIGRDKIRLGIAAPKETPVHREEIFLEIRRQQAERRRLDEVD